MRSKFLQFFGLVGAAFLTIMLFTIASDVHQVQEVTYVREQSVESFATTSPTTNEIQSEPIESTSVQTKSQSAAAAQSQNTGNQVYRVKNPYSSEPKSEAELYTTARAAIVNIYCQSSSQLGSISGSGVVIDPRGVILTNAHVAQYMLLATDSRLRMECFIRTGSPSQNRYKADVLFLPAAWIAEHAGDIAANRPKGTGEHDYALLAIASTIDGSPLPAPFPYLPVDTRETIAFTGDKVLLAGYPAEFAIQGSRGTTLYPTSVFTRIGELLTFGERSVDLISLGGAVLAQSGSSGGAVVNGWGLLVGIISTTSDGATTAERELRAITLSYIDRDLEVQTGLNLTTFLASDLAAQAANFMSTQAPALTSLLTSSL
jgi:S1-C subfamily serine protease